MKTESVEIKEATPGCLDGITRKLDLLLAISLCGFVFSVAYYYWRGFYRGQHWPYSSPLYDPKDHFNDFNSMVRVCRDLPQAAYESLYLPAANLYFHFFGLFSHRLSFGLFLLAPMLCLVWCAVRCMNGVAFLRKLAYLIGIFLISYPFLFAMDRGNLDLHLFLFIALFLYFYQQSASWTKGAAAFCLAVAIAFKAFPVLLAMLYFKDRRYRELVLAGAFTVALTLLASVPEGGIIKGMGGFLHNVGQASVTTKNDVGHFNVGLYDAGWLALRAMKRPEALRWFISSYTFLSFALLLLVCGLAARRKLALWRSATALACAMCFLPTISYDYRLMLVIAPLCLFIGANTPMTRQNTLICVIFGLLLVPKGQMIMYFNFDSTTGYQVVTPACLINPLLLLSLTMLVLLPSKNDELDPVKLPPASVEAEMNAAVPA